MASRDLDRGRAHDPGDLCASRQSQRPHPDPHPHPTQISRGWSTAALATSFDVCEATVTNVRGRFAKGGLEAVLHDKVQQHRRSALSGLQTAHLIAVVCSPAPDGHDHWTVRLLAQKAVELGFVTNISPNTIHELLKKTNSSPGSMNTGACPRSEAS